LNISELRFTYVALALLIGLGVRGLDLMPREIMQPPGYPPGWEYSVCDRPWQLTEHEWVTCVMTRGW